MSTPPNPPIPRYPPAFYESGELPGLEQARSRYSDDFLAWVDGMGQDVLGDAFSEAKITRGLGEKGGQFVAKGQRGTASRAKAGASGTPALRQARERLISKRAQQVERRIDLSSQEELAQAKLKAEVEKGAQARTKAATAKKEDNEAWAARADALMNRYTDRSGSTVRQQPVRKPPKVAFANAAPEAFVASRDTSKYGAFLSSSSAEELKDHQLYLSEDGKVGYALDKDGDLQNVFNNGGPKGAGSAAVLDAMAKGAKTLDAFAPDLPELYSSLGWEAVAKLPFDEEFAPEGWQDDKFLRRKPPVVFMVNRGEGPGEFDLRAVPPVSDYATAKSVQSRSLGVDADPDAPGAGDGGGSGGPDRARGVRGDLGGGSGPAAAEPGLLGKKDLQEPKQAGGAEDVVEAARTNTLIELPQAKAYVHYEEYADEGVRTEEVIAGVPGAREYLAEVERLETELTERHGGKDSSAIHKDEKGEYTPERRKLHKAILGKLFDPDKVAEAMPEPGQKPQFTILGGRGGSGKSFFTKAPDTPLKAKSIVIDSDWVKEQMPEYEGWNSGWVHSESSHIAGEAFELGRALGVNVVFDTTLISWERMPPLIKEFTDAGYRTEGYYMFLPPQMAAKSALARGMKGGVNGRNVDVDYVLTSRTNEKSFDKLSPHFEHWEVWTSKDGFPPKQVQRKQKEGV